jgi:predicted RNase H-like HicB family nuclease
LIGNCSRREHYPIEIFWSDEDDGFVAVARDLPGCSAFGVTREEALREIEDAIEAWIGAAERAGNPVPEPTISVSLAMRA